MVRVRFPLLALIAVALWLVSKAAWAGPQDGLPKPAAAIERMTPRRTVEGIYASCRQNDFEHAGYFLDLQAIAKKDQATRSRELAERLCYLLERELRVEVDQVIDEPLATAPSSAPSVVTKPAKPADVVVTLGTLTFHEETVVFGVSPVRFDDGMSRWLVTRAFVARIDDLYGVYGPSRLESRIPKSLKSLRLGGVEVWQWLAVGFALLGSYFIAWLIAFVVVAFAQRLVLRSKTTWDDDVLLAVRRPLRLCVAALLTHPVLDALRLVPTVYSVGYRLAQTALILGIAWLVSSLLEVATKWLEARFPEDSEDELRRRGLRTKLVLMRRVLSFVVVLLAIAAMLLQFETVRTLGVSILASAGLVGVVFGFAAQRWLAGVIAGIQLSITQPIRLGDTVFVEGEQGLVEEINLTYVIVKIWDERRLIMPISRFLEQPFQNWTRLGTELSGTIFFQVDFTTDVAHFRAELEQTVAADPRWDGRICTLLVTEMTERALTLRALVSAKNPTHLWELRCAVREAMVRKIVTTAVPLPLARAMSVADPPKSSQASATESSPA